MPVQCGRQFAAVFPMRSRPSCAVSDRALSVAHAITASISNLLKRGTCIMPFIANSDGAPPAETNPGAVPHQSVESMAQRRDAERELSADVGYGTTLRIYRLVPTAAPGDPNWDLAPSEGEIKVVARTAGDARLGRRGTRCFCVSQRIRSSSSSSSTTVRRLGSLLICRVASRDDVHA